MIEDIVQQLEVQEFIKEYLIVDDEGYIKGRPHINDIEIVLREYTLRLINSNNTANTCSS